MLSIAADNYGENREKQEQRTERERVTIDPEIVFEQQQRNTGGICDLEARREAAEEEGGGAGGKRTRGKLNLAEYLSPDQRCSRRLFTGCACRPTLLK